METQHQASWGPRGGGRAAGTELLRFRAARNLTEFFVSSASISGSSSTAPAHRREEDPPASVRYVLGRGSPSGI